ncbi:hypothetical protein DFH11DRAFT_1691850 [Phellopilus nigrolimitatus]|nr:hypothetical protein DFH11DRAFT_1691850 [Phellopilus nigrolimitatus]
MLKRKKGDSSPRLTEFVLSSESECSVSDEENEVSTAHFASLTETSRGLGSVSTFLDDVVPCGRPSSPINYEFTADTDDPDLFPGDTNTGVNDGDDNQFAPNNADDDVNDEWLDKEVYEKVKRERVKELTKWLPLRQEYLDELIRHDGRGEFASGEDKCPACASASITHRCLDCFGFPVSCKNCLLVAHRSLPLHAIEKTLKKWNGSFWEKDALRMLGLTVELNHRDGPCKNPAAPFDMVVIHVNGFHVVSIRFCGCKTNSGDWQRRKQTLRARWFPASQDNPSSVFTFETLDLFHELTLQGKVSAHDFYVGLMNRSDNTGVRGYPKRYDEFLRVTRMYRHLILVKRAGRGHDPEGVDATRPGQLALECPACPHPGKNLPNEWVNSDQPWLYRLVLAIDANFRLKMKDRGAKDLELGPGWAYFVEDKAYKEEVVKHPAKIERNSCDSTFQAIERATSRVNDGYSVTGVGSIICARNGLVRPNGVADLQKGERYANMDYIFLASIIGIFVNWLLVSYDISCQWIKNLSSRVSEYPPDMQESYRHVVLTSVVPKFHLNAHGKACQGPFSLNFLKWSARTDGEGIERGWSHINPVATSTREMGPGFRHDTIDDHWSAWNWHKITGLGALLFRKLKEAVEESNVYRKQHNNFTATFKTSEIHEWQKMVDSWQNDPHNLPNPYAEPAVAKVRLELAKEESSIAQSGISLVHEMSPSALIVRALELEDQSRSYVALVRACKTRPQPNQAAMLEERRTALIRKVQKWRAIQLIYMPTVASLLSLGESPHDPSLSIPAIDNAPIIDPFIPPLLLPSSLPISIRQSLTPRLDLVAKETRLRVAQAEDALAELRRLLKIRATSIQFKKTNMVGQRAQTRARSVLTLFQEKIDRVANRYRAAQAALVSLGPEEKQWDKRFPTLDANDVRGPGKESDDAPRHKRKKATANAKESEGRRVLSWIWTSETASKDDCSDDELVLLMRCEWARSQARAERWEEEKVLLMEEMRRTLAYSDWKATWWRGQEALRDNEHLRADIRDGLRAYAQKQADMWGRLAVSFAARWYKLLVSNERYRIAAVDASLKTPNKKFRGRLREEHLAQEREAVDDPEISQQAVDVDEDSDGEGSIIESTSYT